MADGTLNPPATGRTPEKPKPSRSQLAWTLIVLVWLPMAALLVWGRGGLLDLSALRKEVGQLKAEVSKLEEENSHLRGEIQKLQTDPSAYETLARERFFLKKPGERVLYLPVPPASPRPAPPAVSTGVQATLAVPPSPDPVPADDP